MNQRILCLLTLAVGCGGGKADDDDDDDDGGTSGGPADLLIVMDSSTSMADEGGRLIEAIGALQAGGSGSGFSSDLNVAITTPTLDPSSAGWTVGVDGGEAGTFVGSTLTNTNEDFTHQLRTSLACHATCWDDSESLPSDPTYTGTSGNCPLPDQGVTTEYLECLCVDADYPEADADWRSNSLCGSGAEKPMETAALALCRAVSDPPDACWDYLPSSIESDDAVGSNNGLLREGTPTYVMIVTDEGDSSLRYGTGESAATSYIDLFNAMGLDVKVAVVGPAYICEEVVTDLGNVTESCSLNCNSGNASLLETERLFSATELSGGLYDHIAQAAGPCDNGVDDDGDGEIDEDDEDCGEPYGGDYECRMNDFVTFLDDLEEHMRQ